MFPKKFKYSKCEDYVPQIGDLVVTKMSHGDYYEFLLGDKFVRQRIPCYRFYYERRTSWSEEKLKDLLKYDLKNTYDITVYRQGQIVLKTEHAN